MPRSELFRSLRGLVADHATAERTGVPLHQLRERRAAHGDAEAAHGIGRRDVLKASAALGGITAFSSGSAPAWAAGRPGAAGRATPRVAVVGAGIAGLNAVLELNEAGVPCTLYEASSEIGGRMRSERHYWNEGQTSEWGGELIDGDHDAIRGLARRFGLECVDVLKATPPRSTEVLHFAGEYYPVDQADEDFPPVYEVLKRQLRAAGEQTTWDHATQAGIELDNTSVYEWIENWVPGGHTSRLGRYIDVAYTVEYGADTTEQSALNLVYLMAYQKNPRHFSVWGTSDERFRIAGGNQRLPEAVAAALPAGTLQHGWQLLAVRATPDGAQELVFDEGGRTRVVRADHAVLALPLGVLQRIDLSRAGLDQRKRAGLAAMRMGHCTKLNMQLHERAFRGTGPWPGVSDGETFTDRGYQQAWDATRGQDGTGGILVQYGGGSGADAFQPPDPFLYSDHPYVRASAERILREIDEVLPGVRDAWNGRAALSAWHRNPLSYGAYAYWPVGYCHRFLGYERVRQGNLHFAAEHTSIDYQGFMNGAAEEGARVAREIADDVAGSGAARPTAAGRAAR